MKDLLEQHLADVYRFALRLTGRPDMAEDLAQETVLRAWRSRDRLREAGAGRVWLFRICVNAWRDLGRRKKAEPEASDADVAVEQVAAGGISVERTAEQREDVARAMAALDGLPPRQREVLYLVSCEGMNMAEVAEVLEVSQGAVKAHLSTARRTMRELLADVVRERCATGQRDET